MSRTLRLSSHLGRRSEKLYAGLEARRRFNTDEGVLLLMNTAVLLFVCRTFVPIAKGDHQLTITGRCLKNRFFFPPPSKVQQKAFESVGHQGLLFSQRRLLARRSGVTLETQKHGFQVQKLRLSLRPALLSDTMPTFLHRFAVQRRWGAFCPGSGPQRSRGLVPHLLP